MEWTDIIARFEWSLRTLLRLFLVVAGIFFVVRGIRSGSDLDLFLGVLAVIVGVIGLVHEYREAET